MKIDVLNENGKSIDKLELDESVFGVEPNLDLIGQYLRVYLANQRQGTSSTKTRAEVRGGGRKPWAQKHTGRSRQGSIRSPIWVKGGIAHGPKPKDWSLSLSEKMKKAAMVSILSSKASHKKIKILDKISLKEPKTKKIVEVMKNLGTRGRTLLVTGENDLNVRKSSGNIKNLNFVVSENLNGYQLMKAQNIIFVKDAVLKIQEKYSAK